MPSLSDSSCNARRLVTHVDNHRATFEQEGFVTVFRSTFNRKSAHFNGCVALNENTFYAMFDEFEVEALKRSEQVGSHSVTTGQIIVVAERFDDIGMVIRHDRFDIAASKSRPTPHLSSAASLDHVLIQRTARWQNFLPRAATAIAIRTRDLRP
jgi:hypothetical protein